MLYQDSGGSAQTVKSPISIVGWRKLSFVFCVIWYETQRPPPMRRYHNYGAKIGLRTQIGLAAGVSTSSIHNTCTAVLKKKIVGERRGARFTIYYIQQYHDGINSIGLLVQHNIYILYISIYSRYATGIIYPGTPAAAAACAAPALEQTFIGIN
jgi:hypothetical protein